MLVWRNQATVEKDFLTSQHNVQLALPIKAVSYEHASSATNARKRRDEQTMCMKALSSERLFPETAKPYHIRFADLMWPELCVPFGALILHEIEQIARIYKVLVAGLDGSLFRDFEMLTLTGLVVRAPPHCTNASDR